MNWLNAAYGFVFFCNLVFMIGAAYVLTRIMDSTTQSRIDLLKAASHTIEAGNHLKIVARRAVTELERVNDSHMARENSNGRAVQELSFQVKNLIDRLSRPEPASLGRDADAEELQAAEDMRAKLQAELNNALSKNHVLQDEIEQTKYRLKDASTANSELRQELSEVKGIKQSVVDNLMQRTADLEVQLQKARERAKAAELHAEANAVQLDAIREQINAQKFARPGAQTPLAQALAAPEPAIDQSALIQDQQDQIDVLAGRERALLAKIEALENEFQRHKTEKDFIEDRFLQLDAAKTAPAPLSATPQTSPKA
jgi:myosin heavy subunit